MFLRDFQLLDVIGGTNFFDSAQEDIWAPVGFDVLIRFIVHFRELDKSFLRQT